MSQQDKQLTQNTHIDVHSEIFFEVKDKSRSNPYKVCGIFPHFENGKYYVRFYPARKSVGEGYVMELERFLCTFSQKE